MPEISFPSATDTPPRIDYINTPWIDPVNGGEWLWAESLSAWNPRKSEVFDLEALDVGIDPNTLTITGITSPANSDPLVLKLIGLSQDADGNITLNWSDDTIGLGIHVGSAFGVWTIRISGDGYPYLYEATKISSAKTPVGLTDWTIITGAGQPILEGNDKFPSYVGQLGTAYPTGAFSNVDGPPWFRWDGQNWREDIGNPLRLYFTPVSDQLFIEAGLTNNIPTSIPALTLRLNRPTFGKSWSGSASGVDYFMGRSNDGTWEFKDLNYPSPSYKARSVSTTDESPIDVTAWTVITGTGQPVITGTVANPPIDVLGKTAIVNNNDGVSLWSAVSWGEWAEITNTTAAAQPIIRTTAEGAPTHPAVSILSIGQMCRVGDGPSYTWYRAETWTSWARDETLLGTGVRTALALPVGTNGSVQLYGEPLTPTSITLPEVASIVPALNSIGLKNGKITIGDGVTTGGIPVQARTMKGMFQFNTGSQPISGAFTRVAAIPIYPADFLTGGVNPFYKMYGEITLSNDTYSANIKDWGIGFAFNNDSLLSKSDESWIYGSLHPAPGTAKDLTWMTMKLRGKSRFYPLSNNEFTFDDQIVPVYTRYGVDASLPSNVTNYPKGSMPNNSGSQRISGLSGGNLWLMVHAEKITGQPVGGIITVNYDLTFEFP
jgi:hypothetical protein